MFPGYLAFLLAIGLSLGNVGSVKEGVIGALILGVVGGGILGLWNLVDARNKTQTGSSLTD